MGLGLTLKIMGFLSLFHFMLTDSYVELCPRTSKAEPDRVEFF